VISGTTGWHSTSVFPDAVGFPSFVSGMGGGREEWNYSLGCPGIPNSAGCSTLLR